MTDFFRLPHGSSSTTTPAWLKRRADSRNDARARRAARRAGFALRKLRGRWSPDNHGGFMVVDAQTGIPAAGYQYDLTAADVIAWCAE